jgi:hypothetical protein
VRRHSAACLIQSGPRWPFSRWGLTQAGLPSGDSAGINGVASQLSNLTASVGPRCPSRPRRPGLESVHGLLPRGERLEDKGGAARLLVVEERRAPQLIVLGNRVVLEDVAPAARPPTMLRVTSSHHNNRSMSPSAAAVSTTGPSHSIWPPPPWWRPPPAAVPSHWIWSSPTLLTCGGPDRLRR